LISNHFRDSVGGPEKAGVGGSIQSHFFDHLAIAKQIQISSREQDRSAETPPISQIDFWAEMPFASKVRE